MKASASLTLIFLTLAVFHCSEAKIDKAKKEAAIKKCQAETSASDEDVKKVRKEHVVPDSEEGKCFIACGFNHYDMLKDNRINLEGVNAFFEKLYDEQEKRDIAIKAAASCAATESVSGLNDCHVAAKYFACLQRHPDFVKMKDDFDV
uniref:Odorant-binding protein 3 n=2 Tax=Sogatella furcifera TaxID=113103 RepID=V5T818_SOGFU|nr:odorant-binding protein 3 [Sogatella furcifera]